MSWDRRGGWRTWRTPAIWRSMLMDGAFGIPAAHRRYSAASAIGAGASRASQRSASASDTSPVRSSSCSVIS